MTKIQKVISRGGALVATIIFVWVLLGTVHGLWWVASERIVSVDGVFYVENPNRVALEFFSCDKFSIDNVESRPEKNVLAYDDCSPVDSTEPGYLHTATTILTTGPHEEEKTEEGSQIYTYTYLKLPGTSSKVRFHEMTDTGDLGINLLTTVSFFSTWGLYLYLLLVEYPRKWEVKARAKEERKKKRNRKRKKKKKQK